MLVASLPAEVQALLTELRVPARLEAHLRLVYTVALELLAQLQQAWPGLALDAGLVGFGAATHDIGKALVPFELRVPGKTHEKLGQQLLLEHGFSRSQARFCVSHGSWDQAETGLEDLLVALADSCWKGKRDATLENRLTRRIAQSQKQP